MTPCILKHNTTTKHYIVLYVPYAEIYHTNKEKLKLLILVG